MMFDDDDVYYYIRWRLVMFVAGDSLHPGASQTSLSISDQQWSVECAACENWGYEAHAARR